MKNAIFSSSTGYQPALTTRNKIVFVSLWLLIFLVALYLRMSGIFRGLGGNGSIFHPDEAKQILALFNFLNGDYVRYYGSLFYDGYPYGLNHLDEYLLRPLLFFLSPDTPESPSLYYYARLLRIAYGMAIVTIGYKLVYNLVHNRAAALLAMFLLAISPLSVTVTHFATGDIGVDLFTALCFLCLLLYMDTTHKKIWLFTSGIAAGAAFSAKYNGLLVGMVPAMVLCFEFLLDTRFRLLAGRCFILLSGAIIGITIFTPNLLLDCNTALANIFANFAFIKNYNVPAEILAKSWIERAILGFKYNSLYIITSLGFTVCLASIPVILLAGKKYSACLQSPKSSDCSRTILILSMALFPLSTFIIALSGKYVVQPFHFSYLQLPLIILTTVLASVLYTSRSLLLKSCSLLIVGLVIVEFAHVSWRENFFWRLEDNTFYEQNLAASFYDKEAFYTHRSGPIRSLYLEPPGNSVFRNSKLQTQGPDSSFWNTLELAPLPQVLHPIGKNWIFLNGPTFPRNDKGLIIHGKGHGQTLKKYIVLPAGQPMPALGFRSGSFATQATVDFGGVTAEIELQSHQQKTVLLEPKNWLTSGDSSANKKEVHIIPLEISVPHNDLWITILSSQKERELFTLFGGGQDGIPSVPQKIAPELEEQYFDALSRLQYLEHSPSWRVLAGKKIPMWEVALPAGHFKLIFEVEGLVDDSAVTIELEDARGELHRQQQQTFQIKKGIQRIEYNFTKAFVPFQSRFLISGLSGTCHMHRFKLFPDYQKLSDDFNMWRISGVQPEWIARFNK